MPRAIAAFLTSAAVLTLAWPAGAEDINSPLVGLWKLTGNTTKIVATGAMQRQAGEHPSGYQLFTKGGHMMFVQAAESRKPPAGTVATDAERVGLFNTLVAYVGTYKLNGSKVLIHFEANATPGIPDRTYAMEVSGDKLTLTADPFLNGLGQQIVSIRTFERRLAPCAQPEEKIMSRSITVTIAATAALVLGLLPGAAFGQQKSLRDQLVGAWTLVSADVTPAGGAKRQDFGANPKGILIFDAGGKYALVQGSPNRPKFKDTNNLRTGATGEEFAAAARTFAANFGTWSVDEGGKILVRNYEIALIPNNDGAETKTSVTMAGDELKLSATAANGARVEAVYRRAK